MHSAQMIFLVLLLAPLAGFLFNGIRFKSHNYLLAGVVATGAAAISFLCSLYFVSDLHVHVSEELGPERIAFKFFEWINVGDLHVDAGFVIDHISAIMVLVITGVGTLIHLFSIGYMSHDERPTKYFAYLNLFLFNMLLLVLGDNLLVMFVGWEGVGLCSYLLIGFWFTDSQKAAAGMKAFVTNRIGDAGFLLGIFVLFVTYGTVDFSQLISLVTTVPEIGWGGPVTMACLFLFVGATGKSAQIPLYVWLPDAMAGPTPVSALIHAATMVTAGVYMIVRLHPVFLMAPNALHVVAAVGACTALFAATIGLTQWDIKKILAYSTVSQLGYMFLACGVGAFGGAMFHLMTHAFFKALMFLGSGSVIHAMHEEQDIRKMGGLKKHMPITHFTFVCGWLAIIGIFPFAGFFSKDEILWRALSTPGLGHPALYVVGLLGAACTAFYMTRLMCLTFWGDSRVAKEVHPHESPLTMTIPLMVLALLSVTGGWVGIPHTLGEYLGHVPNFLDTWFGGTIREVHVVENKIRELSLMALSFGIAGLSAVSAITMYLTSPETPKKIARALGAIYELMLDKYRVDELYQECIIDPIINMSRGLWAFVDVNFIDRATFVAGDAVEEVGMTARTLQNGNMQQYALYIALGVAIIILYVMR